MRNRDAVDCQVGAFTCLRQVRTGRGHRKHSPARGHDPAAFIVSGTRMQDDHSGNGPSLHEAADFLAKPRVLGVTLGGNHHGDRRLR